MVIRTFSSTPKDVLITGFLCAIIGVTIKLPIYLLPTIFGIKIGQFIVTPKITKYSLKINSDDVIPLVYRKG